MRTTQVSHRLVPDEGNPHIDTPAVRTGLQERGFSPGKQKVAVTRLDELSGTHLSHLSSSEQTALAARLANSADGDAAVRFVNDLEHASDVRYFLDEELATTNRLVDFHANKHRTTGQTRGVSNRHLNPELEANDFVHVARNGDVNEVHVM
ncbi:hypothetical protein [Natronosalvus halobius]|uniref:hypothetical protein n=1 Tax=Natronosalvus halobius TaxID=2953746 RepID=UPI0020A1AAD6|nr:hypothetical protein [Natronosalvus halobius]USZ71098.1 hypothetical protein NGM15_13530 [Natronosalvus halobius]